MEALRVGYRIPFDRPPPLSECPISLPAYSPHSIRGVALNQELQNLLRKGAVEPAPQSGFLQPSFPRQEGFGVLAPHHRFVDPERLRHLVTLPHGDSSVSPELHSSRRLDDLPGPARRVSSGSSSSRFASFSSLRGRREALPVQGPLLRSYDRASSLHEDYGTSVRHPPQAWGQDASLPGRLAHPGLFQDRLSSVEGQAPSSLYRTWHPGQSHEVVSGSLSVHSLLGHGDSVSALHCSPHTSTSQQSHPTDRGVPLNPVSSSVPLASHSRPPVFPDSSRLRRNDQDEASPTLPQGPVGLSGRPVPGLLVSSLSRGSSLVVEAGSAEGGREPLPSSSGHQLLLGCFRRELGSPSRRAPRLGSLAPPSESSLYQYEGASGSSARPSGLRTSDRGHVGSAVLRQHHHSSLSSSVGRDVFVHPELHGQGGSPLGRESSHSSPSPVHHGVVQRHRRRPKSPKSGDRVGMDPSPGGSRSAGPQVASYDRSLRNLLDS